MWILRILIYAEYCSPFKKTLAELTQGPCDTESTRCSFCDVEGPHSLHRLPRQVLKECQACRNVVVSGFEANRLLRFILPGLGLLLHRGLKSHKEQREKLERVLVKFVDKNYDHRVRFNLSELHSALESVSRELPHLIENQGDLDPLFRPRRAIETVLSFRASRRRERESWFSPRFYDLWAFVWFLALAGATYGAFKLAEFFSQYR